MKKLKDNWFNLVVIAALLSVIFIGRSCEQKDDLSIHDSKTRIENAEKQTYQEKQKRDSIITKVDTVTKIVTKYVTKYKTIRHDSLIPCETKLIVCDTVIAKQDTLIQVYKSLARQDSSVIASQETLIKIQDLTITDLTKSVKKERRKRKLITASGGIIAALIMGIIIVK